MAVSVLIASVVLPYSQEELFAFKASVSPLSLVAHAAVTYWPSLLTGVVLLLVAVRSRNLGWLAVPVSMLALQQSTILFGLMDHYPHHPWLLREFVVACLMWAAGGAVTSFLALWPKPSPGFRGSGLLAASAVGAFTVILDWAFVLFFASPMGGTVG